MTTERQAAPATALEDLNDLKATTVVAAALAAALTDPDARTPGEALRRDPGREAVLRTLRDPEALLQALWNDRSSRGNNLTSVLTQSASAAAGTSRTWSDLSDEAMIAQGRSSALMARVILARVAPEYGFLQPGRPWRVLDVGTGIGAIATALAESGPEVEVTGIDIAEQPLRIAREQLARFDEGIADRVRYERRDVVDLAEVDAYDLVWMPVPFIPDAIIDAALARVTAALRPGGLLVLGTLRGEQHPRLRVADAWLAELTGGSTLTTGDVGDRLPRLGYSKVAHFETVPGGPVLIAAVAS